MNYEQIAVWSQVISAILFLAAFVGIWLKFIAPAVLHAQDAHNKVIAEAEHHRNEAKAALEALQHENEGAVHDAELIRKRAVDQGQREKDRAITETREAGERAVLNAAAELARARARASEAFRVELLDKALHHAQAEAKRRVDAAMNTKLVDGFVANLERVGDRG